MIDLDIRPLEGVDVDNPPPCETFYRNPSTGHEFPCGKPSVVRVYMRCPDCGHNRALFLCVQCKFDAEKHTLKCTHCWEQGHSGVSYTFEVI